MIDLEKYIELNNQITEKCEEIIEIYNNIFKTILIFREFYIWEKYFWIETSDQEIKCDDDTFNLKMPMEYLNKNKKEIQEYFLKNK